MTHDDHIRPRLPMARRHFLQLSAAAVVGGLLAACSNSDSGAPFPASTATQDASTGMVGGTLPVPALLAPTLRGGTKVFQLTAQTGESQFIPGAATATAGFNGAYLGPTLRASKGDAVQVEITNQLGETTTVHWHGMHLPAAMDGGPMQTIAAAATWSPDWTIGQEAATLWYHPHMLGETQRQVAKGMVGLFILDDSDSAQKGLPRTYGVDDLPLILQTQTFDDNGQLVLDGDGDGRGGRDGDNGRTTTLVNGAIMPAIETAAPRVRLRVLNASGTAIFTVGSSGGGTFHQVASDGGLLPAPVALTQLRLAPAERAELVVEVPTSGSFVLESVAGGDGDRGGENAAPAGPLLTITAATQSGTSTAASKALPATLATIARISPDEATQTRDFVLAGDDRDPTINGQSMTTMADMMDMSRTLQVGLDTVEVWNLINQSRDTHVFHVHDIQFQILDRNGSAPDANESGWKDTVVVPEDETVRIVMRFTDYADPETPYMYHCHLLNHEDNGMMGQFVVV